MNHDDKTDDEINEAVLCHVIDIVFLPYYQNGVSKIPDYCNSPADAWPIIVENRINIITAGSGWMAFYVPEEGGGIGSYIDAENENPLRAAMIVFLKMKEAEL